MDDRDEKNLSNTATDITVAVVTLILVFAVFGVYLESLLNWYGRFLDWLYSGNLGSVKTWAMVIFLTMDFMLLVFIVFTLLRYQKLQKTVLGDTITTRPVSFKDTVRDEWAEIQKLLTSKNSSDWSMALIRADGLLNDILRNLGYEGDTMADRLKIVDPTKLKSLNEVWSAHRLRNIIVHGPTEEYPKETLVYAIKTYEHALKELGTAKE